MQPTDRGEKAGRAALGVFQIAALVWFRAPVNGFPLDDAWIHQVVARTFASSGTLGYAPGHHGAGATSYLWALLLGVNLRFFHIDPVHWSFALSLVMAVVSGQLLYAIFVRVRPAGIAERPWRGACLAASGFACVSGNVLWFAHSGMEVSCLVALSLTAIWAATHVGDNHPSVRHALVAGLAAGLCALVRPEAAVLGAVVLVYPIGRKRAWSERALLAAPWLLAVGVYALVNLANTGHVSPSTFAGRRWLWFDASRGQSHAELVLSLAVVWSTRLRHYVLGTGIMISWIAMGVAAYGAVRLVRLRNHGLRLLFVWGAAHAALYAVLLPTTGHGGRYQPFVPLLFTACIAFGTALIAWDMTRVFARAARLDVLAAAMIVWIPALLSGASAMKKANDLAVEHIATTELGAGTFVRSLPRDARVASFDIGGIGWAADRAVVDLGGLQDPAVAAVLQQGRTAESLAEQKIAYVILPEDSARDLPVEGDFRSRLGLRHDPTVRLVPVFQVATPLARWVPAVEATSNASAGQVVYAVEYTGAPAPRRVPSPPSASRLPLRDAAGLVRREDRAVAEHMMAVLAAWGAPVHVSVSSGSLQTQEAQESDAIACEVVLGPSGLTLVGCAALGEHRAVEAAIFEMALPYLDANDLGGAARAALHAIARAKRQVDASFAPKLAPLPQPRLDGGRSSISRTMSWGVPLLLGIFACAWLLRFARVLYRLSARHVRVRLEAGR